MAGLNLGYANNSSGGEFWHTAAYVSDIKEIMYYARLLETWLGYSPTTTLIIEDFPGTSPVWMRLTAKAGCWDTSAYGGTAPSIFDVVNKVRQQALGLSSYSFTQTVPAYLHCIRARNELQEALGAPISQFPWVMMSKRIAYYWPDVEDCETYEANEQTSVTALASLWSSYYCTMRTTKVAMCAASGWWSSCSTFILLLDPNGVEHTETEMGETSSLAYDVNADSGYPTGHYGPATLGGLLEFGGPTVTDAGLSGPHRYDVSSTVGGLSSSEVMHVYTRVDGDCETWNPSAGFTIFNWEPSGIAGYIWGME